MGADIPCKWDRSTPGGSIPVEQEWGNFIPNKCKELKAKQTFLYLDGLEFIAFILKVSFNVINITSNEY